MATNPRPRREALVVVALVVGWLIGAGPTAAQVQPWTDPVKVSIGEPGMKDWFPDVATDAWGNVNIIWNQAHIREDEDFGKLQYRRLDNQGWSTPSDLAIIWNGNALRSSLTVDVTGRLYVIYKGFGDLDQSLKGVGPEDLWFTSAPGDQAEYLSAWTKPVRLTRGTPGYFSQIALDSRGGIHAIWTEADAAGKYGLYYSRSVDGGMTWSNRTPLEASRLVWWYRAQLVVDAQDRLHVTWEVANPELGSESLGFGTTAGARYALSTDRGDTWAVTPFSGTATSVRSSSADATPPGPQQPAVGVDGNGVVLFVSREPGTDRVVYRQSFDGLQWSEPRPLPGVRAGAARPFDIYSMATDSAGQVHLVLVGYPGSSDALSLLYTVWDGQAWGRPETIVSGAPYPEYPRLMISNGNVLNLVWFGGDKKTDRIPVGVWYSRAVANVAPVSRWAVPPPPFVAAAPTPTVAADRAPIPAVAAILAPPEPLQIPATARPAPDGLTELPGWPEELPAWLTDLLDGQTFGLFAGLAPAAVVLLVIVGLRVRLLLRPPGARESS